MSKLLIALLIAPALLCAPLCAPSIAAFAHGAAHGEARHNSPRRVYTGFDKNDYPGDDLLPGLRKTFAFTGYWLNDPPGVSSNPWSGKRSVVRAKGFGFVILFNGRLYADLKAAALKGQDEAALGRADADAAVAAAEREGFPARAVLFLDQEEGGHLLPEQSAYLFAWVDAVGRSRYRPGVYCSGIAAKAGDPGSTAGDILAHYQAAGNLAGGRGKSAGPRSPHPPSLWVANDECPPAPGCAIAARPPAPSMSGTPSAALWQYAQSPRREQFTAACATTYSAGNACYAPGIPNSPKTMIDLNSANSADPSGGR